MVLAKKSKSQTNNEASVQSMINKYVKRAHESLDIMANFDQEKIDKICEAVAIAGEQNNYALAKMAVEETGRGVVEDKAIKICSQLKTFGIHCDMKKQLVLLVKIKKKN